MYPGKKFSSMAELLEPYKGKIVYLDIWGTWCGPCRIEMSYVDALKKKFKGKDIVFLYLDVDPDEKGKIWQQYVQFYGIEGEHYRLTSKEVEPYWDVIKNAGGKTSLYPSYVLIDRQGKIINANALRPSDRESLYKQLNDVL